MSFLEIFVMTGYIILSLFIWIFTLGIILATIGKLDREMKSKNLIYVLYFVLTVGVAKAQSPFEEEITLPTYDESNSEMMIIDEMSDWSHINDADKKYFFVKPGDYSGGKWPVYLRKSGTADSKRYIVLYNGNNTHPGKLDRSELAKVDFIFDNTDYWVVDRMAYWDEPDAYNPIQIKNSDNNP